MPFENSDFNTPDYLEEIAEPKKVVIISCEGCVTEPEYFKAIKRKLSSNLKNLVEIEIVPKPSTDSKPQAVLNNLEDYITSKYDFDKETDILWLVIDRESVKDRKDAIENIIPECQSKGYSIALSNPTFELWLLLHLTDIIKYNVKSLLENNWDTPSKNRRYIDKELSNILSKEFNKKGYNKKTGCFNLDIVELEHVKRAISQEKLFCNSYPEILDNLGSKIGPLIEDFLDLSK
jgi:hypothetical protein